MAKEGTLSVEEIQTLKQMSEKEREEKMEYLRETIKNTYRCSRKEYPKCLLISHTHLRKELHFLKSCLK